MKDSRSLRWWGVVTLFVIVAISYVDRINISVLITDHDFLSHIGLTPDDRTRQGLLATAFMVGYGVSSFVLTPFCAGLLGVERQGRLHHLVRRRRTVRLQHSHQVLPPVNGTKRVVR